MIDLAKQYKDTLELLAQEAARVNNRDKDTVLLALQSVMTDLQKEPITIPIAVLCESCDKETILQADVEWFSGKIMIARVERKLDLIAAALGLVLHKKEDTDTSGSAVSAGSAAAANNGKHGAGSNKHKGRALGGTTHKRYVVCTDCADKAKEQLVSQHGADNVHADYQSHSTLLPRKCPGCGVRKGGSDLICLNYHVREETK